MTTLSDNFLPDELDELIGPVCILADLDTSDEDGGREPDELLNTLILAARKVRDREGFMVADGDEDINATTG